MDLLNHCASKAFWIYCKCIFLCSTTAVEVWPWLPFWASQDDHFLHSKVVNLTPNLEDQAFILRCAPPSEVDEHA